MVVLYGGIDEAMTDYKTRQQLDRIEEKLDKLIEMLEHKNYTYTIQPYPTAPHEVTLTSWQPHETYTNP
jgi:hypothetical protein